MAGMNDLLKKYGLKDEAASPEAPKPPETPARPSGKDGGQAAPPPEAGKPSGEGPQPGQFGGGGQTAPPPEAGKPSGGGPLPGQFGGGRQSAPPPEAGKPSGGGPLPGQFGGNAPERRTPQPPERRPAGGGLRALWDSLPPLWGVDLSLALASLAGLVYIGLHWSAILLAIARVIYAVVNGLMNISLFLAIGAAALYVFRRRR